MIINSMNYTKTPYLDNHQQDENVLKRKRETMSDGLRDKSDNKTVNKYEVIKSGNFMGKNEVAALNFKGKGFNKFLASEGFSKFLEYTDAHNLTVSALVSLITAGIIRPALTMAIPGMKDKKDKIYSATQAISSGFLGFGVTMLLTKPLDDAVKKVSQDPKKYNCNFLAELKDKINNLNEAAKDAKGKELKNLENQKKTLELLLKNIPEWIICVPRAMLTIALIPLILKYVFGLTKTPKPKPVESEYDMLKAPVAMGQYVALAAATNNNDISFKGNIVKNAADATDAICKQTKKENVFYGKITDFIAKHITAPMINMKWLQKLSDKLKDSQYLFNHISTFTSAIISGVYMTRTLNNKNLEDDKKKILAVNQGLTFALSTVLSYFVDSKLNNWWDRVTAKFLGAKAANDGFADDFAKEQRKRLDKIKELKKNKVSKEELSKFKNLAPLDYAKTKNLSFPVDITKMKNLVNGMTLLKKMLVFGTIFRLIVPLASTPLASWIDEIHKKHLEKNTQKISG